MTVQTSLFDIEQLKRNTDDYARDFKTAKPFPHLVLDDLLVVDPVAMESFPDPNWPEWTSLAHNYSPNKRACDDISVIPEPMASLIRQLSEPRFLKILEQITGIKRLLPDPYLTGGGLHLSGPGGVLNPHTDFHHYRALNLYRRINVLIYLNEEWSIGDGGCLSLFEEETGESIRTVVPAWGRTVIFQTDDRSVHGFPAPVVEGKWRKSIALYYYTADEAEIFSGDATTYWKETAEQRGFTRKGRLVLYRGLLNMSRGISVLAHLVNPNQGVSLLRSILSNRRRAAER